MLKENPRFELVQLIKKQEKARNDEVFGGLSQAERGEYNERLKRIHALESEIRATVFAEKSLHAANVEQRRVSGMRLPKHTVAVLKLISLAAGG